MMIITMIIILEKVLLMFQIHFACTLFFNKLILHFCIQIVGEIIIGM